LNIKPPVRRHGGNIVMPIPRTDKLNKEFQHLIAEFVTRELDLPIDFLVTITHVAIDGGLSEARIWLSVLPFEKSEIAIGELIKNKQNLVNYLNKNLSIRRIPRLLFLIDETEQEATELEKIINKN